MVNPKTLEPDHVHDFKKHKTATEYHCSHCKRSFIDPKIPNINKTHADCGSLLKIVRVKYDPGIEKFDTWPGSGGAEEGGGAHH